MDFLLFKVVDVFHPNVQKVTKENIREYMRNHFKKPHVSLFGVKKFYGGGRTKGFVVIYDNEESMKKYEPTYRFKRVNNLFFSLLKALKLL